MMLASEKPGRWAFQTEWLNSPVTSSRQRRSVQLAMLGDIIHWDTTTLAPVNTIIGSFPNQPEDGIFVTAAIINPCPPGEVCNSVPEPGSLALLAAALLACAAGVGVSRRRKFEAR